MNKNKILTLINRLINKNGIFKIHSFWMHKLLTDITNDIPEVEEISLEFIDELFKEETYTYYYSEGGIGAWD